MKQRPGFTLIELVISISISVAILILLSQVTLDAFRVFRNGQGNTQAADKANRVVAAMVRQLRQSQPSPTGAYPIVAATGTSLTVFSSIGAPGVIEQVRYFLNGTNLQRGVIEPVGTPATYPAGNEVVTTVLDNVRNGAQAVFQYFTGSYTGSQAAMNPIVINSIRYAQATIIYDQNLAEAPSAITITLGITFRNVKDNY